MRSTYILVDLENVQLESLEALTHDQIKVIVFVGANQAKVSIDVAASLQQIGARARYVKVAASGRNALDFHLVYYLGCRAAKEPSASFHIISKDTGFDPLIKHLKSTGVCVGRVEAVDAIQFAKAKRCKSQKERIGALLACLQKMKASKPRKVETLTSTIASLFPNQLSEQEIAALIQSLASEGYLEITDGKVTYTLPAPLATSRS